MKKILAFWKANFLTGLTVILPTVVTVAIVVWLFGWVVRITDTLLLFVPKGLTHESNGAGQVHFLWSLMALALAILAISVIGSFARHYFGKMLIGMADRVLLRVPILSNIYRAVKQINDAFTSSKSASFKSVVLVEFPRVGLYSIGLITGTQNGLLSACMIPLNGEVHAKIQKPMVSVFIPSPPLTSGAIVLVAETDVIKLDMSVADGIKFIMSLGSVAPAFDSKEKALGEMETYEQTKISPVTA